MIRQALLFSIAVILLTSCGGQRKMHSSEGHVLAQKVLIMGGGSVASKVVMENLSKRMIGHLNQRGIVGGFIFLGRIQPGTFFDKRALDSLDFDACVVFHPVDSAHLKMSKAGRVNLPRMASASVLVVEPNSYQQKFSVQIYDQKDKSKPVWTRELQFDLDPTDEEQFDEISFLVLNYLP